MYEQNQRDPDPTTIVKLAELFNTSTDYLLGRTEDPHGNIVHKQGAGKSGLTLEELKEELKRNNIDIFAYGGFEGFEDLSPEQQQFIIQNVKNSIEMFKKMKEQNK
jgi:sugar phosphate isomerase/epimerase